MISNKDTFNINKVTVPFSKDDLNNVITKNITTGYVVINYEQLIATISDIQSATEYQVTLNPNSIFNNANNPLVHSDVLIKVEGVQTYNEFVNNVIKSDDNSQWTSFITYSENFKDDIKAIKLNAYKKYLWNYHNIDNWFSNHNIAILDDDRNSIITDFETFKDKVLMSDDYITFIDECNEEDVTKAIKYMINASCQILQKYKVELNKHILTNSKREEFIVLKNPIILDIFIQGTAIQKCKKEWPRIKFNQLDKKSFTTIGLWEA